MKEILLHFNSLYIYLLGMLLLMSWYFWRKSQHDERRSKRFMMKNIRRRFTETKTKFYNEKHEQFLKGHAFPKWITSEGLNILRFAIVILLLFIVVTGILNNQSSLNMSSLLLLGMTPLLLTPKKKYPLAYIGKFMNEKRKNQFSNEVYQLYNDVKSTYQTSSNPKNVYFQVQDLLPYYTHIRSTLEKMLPFLERKEHEAAWNLFQKELDIEEAKVLSIVMQEVENTSHAQAVNLLEQKRNEFSNHLYNRYTDILRRRKSFIFLIVTFGALTVIINLFTVFFMWYREIMSVVNQF